MGTVLTIPTGKKITIPTGVVSNVTAPWDPSQMTTVAWFDANDYSTITESGGSVSAWNDKSGNANHLSQGVGADQPDYTASDSLMNNMPTISGDSSLKTLAMASDAAAVKRVYMVLYYSDGIVTTFENHNSIFYSTDGNVRLTGRVSDDHVWDGLRDVKNFDYRASTGATTYRNGSTTNTNYEDNGLPIPANIFVVTAATATTFTKTWRLLGGSAAWTYWVGGLAEFIFTDGSEDLATQQKVEGYFAWKWWGNGSILAAGHPYKNIAP